MHATKELLIRMNGLRCMGCGRVVAYENIQYHHVCPKYVYKIAKLPVDNSYENGSLLCRRCHAAIHEYLWWEDEYQELTDLLLCYRKEI